MRHLHRTVFLFWSVLFLINIGHGAGWAGVYSILIKKIGSETLADFFLFSALGGFVLNLCLMFFADVLSNEKLVQLSFLTFIAILIATLALLHAEQSFSAPVFTASLIFLAVLIISVPSVYIIQTWNLINKTFSPKSGARIYPFLATAPLIGSMAGGAVAGVLPRFFTTESLIVSWISAISFAVIVTFFLKRTLKPVATNDTPRLSSRELVQNFKDGFMHYRKSSFALHLSVVFMSFWLVCTIVDFCYARALEKVYPTSEGMASFYGKYTTIVNLSALFVQLFLGAKLVKLIGVKDGFMFLPASQILGFVLLAFTPGLAPIVAMMFMQTLIGMSVQANSVNVSFNVFASTIRGKIRTLLEGVINPLGGVVGSLTIIALTKLRAQTPFPLERVLPYTGLLFAGLWFYAAVKIRKSYMDEIARTAEEGSIRDKSDAREALDIENKTAE